MASNSSMAFNVLRRTKTPRITQRGFTTTAKCSLPRILPRRTGSQLSNEPMPSRQIDRLEEKKEIPWYLREQEQYEDDGESTSQTLSSIQNQVNPMDLEPETELPTALQGLHELLLEGPPSPLIARPDEGPLDSETGRRPIRYIHAKQHDVQAWCDWIVVVQVRTSAGSTVSRVAKEIGEFLTVQKPPSVEQRNDSVETDRVTDLEKPSKENHHWKPFKILSREAQDGIRLLHANDPEKWTRKQLAETFKMSVESVRRILRSKWQPSPEIVSRQNRRANERLLQRRKEFEENPTNSIQNWQGREEEEIEKIRKSMAESNREDVDAKNDFDFDDYRMVDEQGRFIEENKAFKQHVSYEGLVPSAGDKSLNQTRSSSSRARTGLLRGDGEWCLVDAGWCVVHVMTAKARITYDVESQYNSYQH